MNTMDVFVKKRHDKIFSNFIQHVNNAAAGILRQNLEMFPNILIIDNDIYNFIKDYLEHTSDSNEYAGTLVGRYKVIVSEVFTKCLKLAYSTGKNRFNTVLAVHDIYEGIESIFNLKEEKEIMTEEFKVGDVVRLNSGGPLMTVIGIENKNDDGLCVSCRWICEEQFLWITLPQACVRKVETEWDKCKEEVND